MIKKVASPEQIQGDFKHLKASERLNTTEEIEDLIFMQSMEGRAHNGAGSFHKMHYVNTSIEDIVQMLGLNPMTVKTKRQALIDEITTYARKAIEGNAPDRLINEKKKPLLGIPEFKDRIVNPDDILRGMYFGGLRDDPDIRRETEKIYNVNIGYGRCYLVDTIVMDELGLDGETLAHEGHEGDLDFYKARGLIISRSVPCNTGPGSSIKYFYIRHKPGPGQSDDAALVVGGLLYNVDVALGVFFLSDAIDTLEKYVCDYSEQDVALSSYIRGTFTGLDITMEQVYEFTYLSSVPQGLEDIIPDSSIRYFLTIDDKTGQTTLETHLNFIEGKPYFPIAVSYKKVLVSGFYKYIKDRVLSAKRLPRIPVPGKATIKSIERTVAGFMKKKFIVVGPEATIQDVLNKLLDIHAELVIIQDEKKNILGIMDPGDFLGLLDREV